MKNNTIVFQQQNHKKIQLTSVKKCFSLSNKIKLNNIKQAPKKNNEALNDQMYRKRDFMSHKRSFLL